MKKSSSYIIITIIGLLVFVVAFFLGPEEATFSVFLYNALCNIGLVILTIVIINILWVLLGGEPIEKLILKLVSMFELLSDGFNNGIYRFFESSSKFATPNEWIEILKNTKRYVDLQGYSLHVWTKGNEFSKVLIDLAKKGVKIRIMIMDYENPFFCSGLNFEQIKSISYESMKGEVDNCSKYMEAIKVKLKRSGGIKNFEFIKCEKGLIECQICRMDDVQHITPYLYSVNASDSPMFIVKGTGGSVFQKYEDEFNSLWELNSQQIKQDVTS